MVVTEQEARDMVDAIEAFQLKDSNAAKAVNDTNLATAQTWFDGLIQIITNPTTRDDALSNFNAIESLQKTETDQFRLSILGKEKQLANEEYKTIKAAS